VRHANSQQLTSYGQLSSTHYASIPAAFSLEFIGADAVGFGCWMKCSIPDNTATQRYTIGICNPDGAGALAQIHLDSTSGVPRLIYGGQTSGATSSAIYTSATTPFGAFQGQWRFIYVENDFAATLQRLYIDGRLMGIVTPAFNDTSVQSGAGAISYIGANSVGTAAWYGNIRDIFIRRGRLTADQVFDMYAKGEIPLDGTYHWPCDDSYGTVLKCYKDGVPEPRFNAAMNGGNHKFSRDVPKPLRVVDLDFNYLLLNNVGSYTFDEARILEEVFGTSILSLSAWCNPAVYNVSSMGLMYVPDAAPGICISLSIQDGYVVQGISSTNGGVDHFSGVPVADHWARRLPLNTWHHIVTEANFVSKEAKIWVNGALASHAVGLGWEANSFQCTAGAWSGSLASTTLKWFGKIGPMFICRGTRSLTDQEVAAWYTSQIMPADLKVCFNPQVNSISGGLIDLGPTRTILTPVTVSAPYGPQPRYFGGPGR